MIHFWGESVLAARRTVSGRKSFPSGRKEWPELSDSEGFLPPLAKSGNEAAEAHKNGKGADRPLFFWHNGDNLPVIGMKDTDPITHEEMKEASDVFFPLLRVVQEGMPENASTEDTLKVMEHIATLAHRMRKEKKKEKAQQRFGLVPNFKGSFEP